MTGEKGIPSDAARQVIDDGVSLKIRNRVIVWSIPAKIKPGQIGAVIKRPHKSKVGDAAGDGDSHEVTAELKRIAPDAGYAVGNRVASAQASWIGNERSLALVEQDAVETATGRVERIH